jgi:hypothetical protein
VQGDRYAGEWPPEQFSRNGIAYEPSELTKSEIYGELLPLLNSRTSRCSRMTGYSASCSRWSVEQPVAVAMQSTILVVGVMISRMRSRMRW